LRNDGIKTGRYLPLEMKKLVFSAFGQLKACWVSDQVNTCGAEGPVFQSNQGKFGKLP
jgi:hypothetical protein